MVHNLAWFSSKDSTSGLCYREDIGRIQGFKQVTLKKTLAANSDELEIGGVRQNISDTQKIVMVMK